MRLNPPRSLSYFHAAGCILLSGALITAVVAFLNRPESVHVNDTPRAIPEEENVDARILRSPGGGKRKTR